MREMMFESGDIPYQDKPFLTLPDVSSITNDDLRQRYNERLDPNASNAEGFSADEAIELLLIAQSENIESATADERARADTARVLLVQAYEPLIARTSRKYHDICDELYSDGLTALLRLIDKTDLFAAHQDYNFARSVSLTLRNERANIYRKQYRDKSLPFDPQDRLEAEVEPSALSESQILRQFDQETLRNLLGQLNPEARRIIERRFLDGAPTKAVALEMDLSIEAVKARQHRALGALARLHARGPIDIDPITGRQNVRDLPPAQLISLLSPEQVSNLLAQLAPDVRRIIEQRFVDNIAIAELAAEMGLEPNTLKARQLRAVKKMRRLYLQTADKGAPANEVLEGTDLKKACISTLHGPLPSKAISHVQHGIQATALFNPGKGFELQFRGNVLQVDRHQLSLLNSLVTVQGSGIMLAVDDMCRVGFGQSWNKPKPRTFTAEIMHNFTNDLNAACGLQAIEIITGDDGVARWQLAVPLIVAHEVADGSLKVNGAQLEEHVYTSVLKAGAPHRIQPAVWGKPSPVLAKLLY